MKYERPTIIGFDSETCQGPPFTLQFYSADRPGLTKILWVDGTNATTKFLHYLDDVVRPGETVVMYGHFLQFDLVSLFWQHYERLVEHRDPHFEFTCGAWEVSGIYGQLSFAKLVNRCRNRQVYILDTFSWFRESLAKAGDRVCPDLPKLPRPSGMGEKIFKKSDARFVAYAERDALLAYRLGLEIDGMHKEFELEQCVSVAGMAAKILRLHYIDEPVVRTGDEITRAALAAYHGGKNNVMPGAWPAIHEPVTSFDISSAYPYAMTQLPSFTVDKAFSSRPYLIPPGAKQVPTFGVYQIDGTVAPCNWPSLFGHDFKPLAGKVSGVWVSGYELNEALRTDEIKLKRAKGFIYNVDLDTLRPTAWQRFVGDFYKLKSTAKSETHRFMYKIMLNSISGKFIQTREVEVIRNGMRSVERQAAGLFHPFIAMNITAHTRATIHRVEHQLSALHTATDGVMVPGNGRDVTFDYAPASGLGSITKEATGLFYLMRGKCYMLQVKGGKKGHASAFRPGWRIAKIAMHGVQCSPSEFEHLVYSDRRAYDRNAPARLRQAVKTNAVPNKWFKRRMVLKVPPLRRLIRYTSNGKPK